MNKTFLDKLDKLLASYGEGREEKYHTLDLLKPTQAWFVDIDRFDHIDQWNELYHLCQKAKLRRIRWVADNDCWITGKRLSYTDDDRNANSFDVSQTTSGWKLFIIRNRFRYVFYYGLPDARLKGGRFAEGGKGWKLMCKEFLKDNINIDNYAIDPNEGMRIKTSPDFPKPYIDMKGAPNGQIFEHCNHIDFHSSYPAGLANTHPEFRPTIERIYQQRKTNPNRKLSLNCFIGCRQSPQSTWKCRWSHLAKDAIADNNRRIDEMDARLKANGDKILGHNTDGIWYQGPVYHGEGEGNDLGQWRNDYVDCRFRAKSRGAYEFIENGKYYPVVRGITELDWIKPREEWQWGDIFKNCKIVKPLFGVKEGLVLGKIESDDAEGRLERSF